MRFVQFEHQGARGLGVELENNGDIVNLSAADESIPTSLIQFLQDGDAAFQNAQRVVQRRKVVVQRSEVRLLAPVDNPGKVVCIGLNYRDHCAEWGLPAPEEPIVFSKFSSCIIGPTDDIEYPNLTEQLDWEGELAAVIGKAGKNVPVEEANDHVFGYTVALDLNARDWQSRNAEQVLLATSMDGFCPVGPVVVTKEELEDVHNLSLVTKVNDEIKQNSNTSQLIFKTDALVSYVSKFFTLYPGDLILTGTPSGTALSTKPSKFLKRGDVVTVEIESIGAISNKVI